MLRYYDAAGEPVSRDEWAALYRTPGYGSPRVHARPGYEARLSWVGLVSSMPGGGGAWLVQALELDDDGRPYEWTRPVWCATRAEAERAFDAAVASLPRPGEEQCDGVGART